MAKKHSNSVAFMEGLKEKFSNVSSQQVHLDSDPVLNTPRSFASHTKAASSLRMGPDGVDYDALGPTRTNSVLTPPEERRNVFEDCSPQSENKQGSVSSSENLNFETTAVVSPLTEVDSSHYDKTGSSSDIPVLQSDPIATDNSHSSSHQNPFDSPFVHLQHSEHSPGSNVDTEGDYHGLPPAKQREVTAPLGLESLATTPPSLQQPFATHEPSLIQFSPFYIEEPTRSEAFASLPPHASPGITFLQTPLEPRIYMASSNHHRQSSTLNTPALDLESFEGSKRSVTTSQTRSGKNTPQDVPSVALDYFSVSFTPNASTTNMIRIGSDERIDGVAASSQLSSPFNLDTLGI